MPQKESPSMGINVDKYLAGNFLSKDDCGDGLTATVISVEMVEVTNNGRKTDKLSVSWNEKDVKPWLPSKGCVRTLGEELGSDTDSWNGAAVEMYNDGSVEMAGARVGGIRIRKITPKAGSQRELGQAAGEDEIPFEEGRDATKTLDRLASDRVSA